MKNLKIVVLSSEESAHRASEGSTPQTHADYARFRQELLDERLVTTELISLEPLRFNPSSAPPVKFVYDEHLRKYK